MKFSLETQIWFTFASGAVCLINRNALRTKHQYIITHICKKTYVMTCPTMFGFPKSVCW